MGKPWTQEDEKTLAQIYKTHTLNEVCKRLGRTKKAVQLRADVLGLTRRINKLSEQDRKWIYELFTQHLIPVADIAEKFDVTPETIRRTIKRIEAAKYEHRPFTTSSA